MKSFALLLALTFSLGAPAATLASCRVSTAPRATSDASAEEVHLTGIVDREVAIGGETTGWFLRYGDKLRVQLLLPHEAFAWLQPGLVVDVLGRFGTRETPERGCVKVFVVRTITQVVT